VILSDIIKTNKVPAKKRIAMDDKALKKILLVEDESVLAMLEVKQIEGMGYDVIHASNGQKAVEIMREPECGVDLILMDIDLGNGMEGTDAAREILRFMNAPIVFLVSRTDKEIAKKTEGINAYGFVVKDFGFTALEASIKSALAVFDEVNKTKEIKNNDSEDDKVYRYMFDENPQPMFIYDLDTLEILQTNDAAINHYGYSRREILQMKVTDFRPPEDVPHFIKHVRNFTKATSQMGEWRHMKKNGEIMIVEITANFVKYKGRNARYVLINDITERRKAADDLRESEEKYRLLAENIKDVIWTVDIESLRFTYISPSVERMFGYAPDEIIGNPVEDIIAPEHIELILNLIKEKLADFSGNENAGFSESITQEFQQRHKSGRLIWTEVVTQFFRNPQSGRLFINGVSRDISQRKNIEEELLEKEKNYKEIFNSTTEAIFIDDIVTGKMIDINEAVVKMYRASSKEEILNGDIGNLSANIPPYTEEIAQKYIKNAIEKGEQTFEWLAKRKDGTHFWIEMTLKKVSLSGEGRIIAVGRDITVRKKAEEELIESEMKYRLLVDHSSVLIWSLDENGNIGYLSPSWSKVTGHTPDNYIGISFLDLIHPDDLEKCRNYFQEIISARTVLEISEYRVKHSDGAWYWHSATSTPVLGPDKRILSIVGVSNNITERKIADEKIRSLLNEKEIILKEVHHRIKNNMNTIYGLLYLQSASI
jgi:PAS domain S-box-containing protein